MALDAEAREHARAGSNHPSLLVVPGTDGAVSALPEARRRKFRDYLAETIADATSGRFRSKAPRDRSQAHDGIANVLRAACATCRGHCCRTAGEHAYLDERTIRRVRAATPSLTPSALLETYLGALPAKSVRGSCVFHGAAGCTLPRHLRSHVCNDYFCGPVERWLASPAASKRQPVVIAVIEDRRVTRSTYVDRDDAVTIDR
jgi:hypothetical protein